MQVKQPKHLAIAKKYGSALEFATKFNPSIQPRCAMHEEYSFMADTPTLSQHRECYGVKATRMIVYANLEDLNTFVGVKEKMPPAQMEMLADVILARFHYLKVPELLLFFFLFKSGEFGEFYGSIDPLKLTNALTKFIAYRFRKLDEYERKQRARKLEEERERWAKEAVPCPDNLTFAKKFYGIE